MNKISFKTRLFTSFTIYGIVLLFVILFTIFKLTETNIKEYSIKNASLKFIDLKVSFNQYIELSSDKLQTINESKLFKNYIDKNTGKKETQDLFLNIAKTNPNIMQLRYIDKNGLENIRVDRKSFNSKPFLVKEKNLQNKANRYYFVDIFKLQKDKIWYSDLDLNIERKKIQKPINPTLRIGFSIFNEKNEKTGILILNLFMKNFLEKLNNLSIYHVYLIDKEGNFLIHPQEQFRWNKYLKTKRSTDISKQDLQKILNNDNYIGKNIFSGLLGLNNSQKLKMVVEPKTYAIQKQINEQKTQIAFPIVIIVVLSFFLAYWLSITPSRLKGKVDKLNSKLKYKIKEITMQKNILQNIINSKKNITLLTNFNEVSFANNAFINFFNIKNINEFNNKYKCILDIFLEKENCINKSSISNLEKNMSNVETGYLFYNLVENTDETNKIVHMLNRNNEVNTFYINISIVDAKNHIYMLSLTDITKINLEKNTAIQKAYTDKLTNVYNRSKFEETLEMEISRAKRYGHPLSLAILDIDKFKNINDTYGHLIGDEILVSLAKEMNSNIRKSDIFARWGGEEFVVLFNELKIEDAINIANALRVRISNLNHEVAGKVTVSFGVTQYKADDTIESIFKRCDDALYKAKENGRNRVEIS